MNKQRQIHETKPNTSLDCVLNAVETIVHYLYEAERYHYFESDPSCRGGHVFESLETLRGWMSTYSRTVPQEVPES